MLKAFQFRLSRVSARCQWILWYNVWRVHFTRLYCIVILMAMCIVFVKICNFDYTWRLEWSTYICNTSLVIRQCRETGPIWCNLNALLTYIKYLSSFFHFAMFAKTHFTTIFFIQLFKCSRHPYQNTPFSVCFVTSCPNFIVKLGYVSSTHTLTIFPSILDSCCLLSRLIMYFSLFLSNMNPDQTAPIRVDWSGFIVFASMIKLVWNYSVPNNTIFIFQDQFVSRTLNRFVTMLLF